MKNTILSLMIVLGFSIGRTAFAHCPNELNDGDQKFCYTIEWLNGEKRRGAQFVEVDELGPHLNPVDEIPQKRILSKLNFKMWLDGDKTHAFAAPHNFSVEPYMLNSLDHPNHGVSHESAFVENEQALQLSKMPLTSMRGCWSLVWKKASGEIISLAHKFEYSNLDMNEQMDRYAFCSLCVGPKPPGDSGEHGDHSGHH